MLQKSDAGIAQPPRGPFGVGSAVKLFLAAVKFSVCGNSSVGRASPCQGEGREFESRFPLHDIAQ